MEQTKHTPGPWKYEKDAQWIMAKSMRNPDGDDWFQVADIRGWGHLQYVSNGEAIQDANGELIASAPETAAERDQLKEENERLKLESSVRLEALNEAVSTIEMLMGDSINPSASMSLASIQKAIQKATIGG